MRQLPNVCEGASAPIRWSGMLLMGPVVMHLSYPRGPDDAWWRGRRVPRGVPEAPDVPMVGAFGPARSSMRSALRAMESNEGRGVCHLDGGPARPYVPNTKPFPSQGRRDLC